MGNSKEIIKDIIISVLIVFVVTLLLIILSYKKISVGKVIGEVEKYNFTEEMKEVVLATTESSEVSDVIVTYSIDSSALKKYEETNEYNKGKLNPFQMESGSVTTTEQNTNTLTNNTNYYYSDNNKK